MGTAAWFVVDGAPCGGAPWPPLPAVAAAGVAVLGAPPHTVAGAATGFGTSMAASAASGRDNTSGESWYEQVPKPQVVLRLVRKWFHASSARGRIRLLSGSVCRDQHAMPLLADEQYGALFAHVHGVALGEMIFAGETVALGALMR